MSTNVLMKKKPILLYFKIGVTSATGPILIYFGPHSLF